MSTLLEFHSILFSLQIGFFKRHKKEEMRRLMSTRHSSPFDNNSTSEARSKVNGNNDNSRIMSSIEDEDPDYEHAHVNPAIDDDSWHKPSSTNGYNSSTDIDTGYLQPRNAFLTDLENVTKRKANSREDINRVGEFDKT